jgi:protein-L-isoaspartate(D-aspartate) O-methyltransferase
VENVEEQTGDALQLSLPRRFDAIAETWSAPDLDDHFIRMSRPHGRLFVVVGRAPVMEARLITLHANGNTTTESLFETVLTPLIKADQPERFVL